MYHFAARLALPLLFTLACLGQAFPSEAQPSRAKPAGLDLEQVKRDLESGDEARMLAALSVVAAAGTAAVPATPLIEAVLRRGASAPVTARSLEVVGDLAQASSSSSVAPYVRHRLAPLRVAAARALSRTGGPVAIRVLRAALRGNDTDLRRVAARGLGDLGASEAVDDLLQALERDVVEAAQSVGRLCAAGQCDRLIGFVGKQPIEVMLDALDRLLLRDGAEVPDEVKLRAIARLRALSTVEIGKFLAGVSQRWPADGSREVKRALDEAARALGSRPEGR